MKKISLKEINPDFKYPEEMFLDDNYILTNPDFCISRKCLQRMKKWKFPFVYFRKIRIDDEINIREEPGEENNKKDEESAAVFYYSLLDDGKDFLTSIKKERLINLKKANQIISSIISWIDEAPGLLMKYPEYDYPVSDYIISHSINCTILSVLIGKELKYKVQALEELSLSILLHDIGMLEIDSRIYQKENALTKAEYDLVRTHTIRGYNLLLSADVPEHVRRPALEHHLPHEAGGNAPEDINSRIHAYSLIAALVCAFEAATSKRPYKDSQSPYSFLLDLEENKSAQYHPVIVNTLKKIYKTYPVGSIVYLNDNSKCIIVQQNKNYPEMPMVKRITDESGKLLKVPSLVQITKHGSLKIAAVNSPEEIKSFLEGN